MRNLNLGGLREAITSRIVSFANTILNSGVTNFLRITGTLPSSPSAEVDAVRLAITSSGSISQIQCALNVTLSSGYTGAERAWGIRSLNQAAGTTTDYAGSRLGNYAIFGQMSANTDGINIGVGGFAANNNAAGKAIGILGLANTPSTNNAQRVGAIGLARAAVNNTGGYFGLAQSNPVIPDAGLVCDASTSGSPHFIVQEGGVSLFIIDNGGGIRVKATSLGSVTLDNKNHVIRCDASAGAITLTLPALSAANRAPSIWYRIKKIDASANTVTIARTGADTIDGAVSKILASQYDAVDIVAPEAGTDWALFGVSSGGVGPTGPTGPQGQIGQTGEEGPEGSQGPPGIQGPTGSIGLTGNNGFDGRPGYDGNDGDDGRMGVPGNDGVAGAIGPQGIQGIPGPQGEDGEIGPMGPIGLTGPQGPSGGGGGTFGQASVDFGTFPALSSVTVAVADAGVGAASRILCSIVPGAGRDLDELELSSVLVSAGDIVAGVGFNLIAVAPNDDVDGAYLINYTRN